LISIGSTESSSAIAIPQEVSPPSPQSADGNGWCNIDLRSFKDLLELAIARDRRIDLVGWQLDDSAAVAGAVGLRLLSFGVAVGLSVLLLGFRSFDWCCGASLAIARSQGIAFTSRYAAKQNV
jgi:hypothetical protein